MIDPTSLAKNRDFRAFGDMLFVRNDDPFELKNQINSPDYTDVTKLLKSYYKDFTRKISDSGKEEVINKAAK